MAKNSRNKGSGFERDIAKEFKKWTGYDFSRTPGSGGWAKAKDAMGDLVCTDENHSRRFPFSVECKFYTEINFEHILLGNKSCKILDFWEQATKDAVRAKKLPFLIMRYNNMPKGEGFVGFDSETSNAILDNYKLSKPHMLYQIPQAKGKPLVFYIFMFSDIKDIEYKKLYKLLRKVQKARYPKDNDLPF